MFDYVAFSDGESTESGFDEEVGDNGHFVGLDGHNGDEEKNDYGVGVDGDHGDGLGLDGDYGDGDYWDGVGVDGDNGDGVGLDGQTFANKEVMRDIFREYAVQEGVVLDRIKNDKQRQTYKCNDKGCPWRAHASWMIDKTTFILKTLVDQHECHRVCNNKETKVKWIAYKFDSIVKSNPAVNVKVLGPCGGILLSALSLDANSGLFPLAVCICEKETKYSWMWFLNNLKMYLQFPSDKHLCFMSDRQKGLIKAVSKHFPTASKRYCARHIYANFRGSYCGDSFKKLFWKASRSSNVYDFKAALNDIGQIQLGAKEWRMLMRKFQERNEECHACRTVLPLRVHAKILKHSKASRQMTIISAGDHEYEIMGPDGTFVVKLRQYNCGCGSWQISGIPCPHAMAAISHNCVPDQKMWPEIEANEVLPPPIQVQLGRPKMQRKRESGEKSKGGRTWTIVCTYCKKAGHNTRTCKEKKEPRKRTPEASSSQPTSTVQSQVHSQHPPSTAEASSSRSQTTKKKKTKKQHPTLGRGSHNPSQSQPQSQLTH
ncbi:hypothetical protein Q3G72_006827 [Acer saccharum]|nr:hypothetical protein Q3G72_006827 [Acer saccharum]